MNPSGLPRLAQEILTPQEIRDLRRSCKLTQHGLARRLNVSRETIVRWERGKQTPNPVYVELLHKVVKEVLEAHGTAASQSEGSGSPKMALHGKCPICGKGQLQPVPVHYSMSVTDTKAAGGILAYQCGQGHIFFIMAKYLKES